MATRLSPRNSEVNALEQRGYLIGKKIGQGSYATVHLADYVDGTSPKKMRLACKIFDKEKAPRDFLDKFFPRELEILTKIENPHIIQVHSILQRGPRVFIFMRYADNGDLLDFVKRNGVVPEQQSKLWFRQMASGLHYLHGKNIAHRDLKCENILLSRRFNVKLADFGFARFCADGDGRRVLSQTYCGSAAYAAPEVVSGTPYNPKLADVWSLGIILFIMLNASMPFDDSNLRKLLKDQMSRNWVFRSRVRDTVSPLAKSIVRHILEPDITLRLTLERVLGHEWVRARKDKSGSLVGRLVHSAPPIHPAQVISPDEFRAADKGRRVFDHGDALRPSFDLGTAKLAAGYSSRGERRSRFARLGSVVVTLILDYWSKVNDFVSDIAAIRNNGDAPRSPGASSSTGDRKPVAIVKEACESGDRVTYTVENRGPHLANSFRPISDPLESPCSVEVPGANTDAESVFVPELICEMVFRSCPVPEKLRALIDSIKKDAEGVLNLDFSPAITTDDVPPEKTFPVATEGHRIDEATTSGRRSSVLFKVNAGGLSTGGAGLLAATGSPPAAARPGIAVFKGKENPSQTVGAKPIDGGGKDSSAQPPIAVE